MSLFWIILTGLALALYTSPVAAQTLVDTADFDRWRELYGTPLITIDDPTGDLFNCQDGATLAGESPSDITRVEVYAAPKYAAYQSGYVVAVHTSAPFQQLLDSSYLMSAAIRALDIGGHTENRMYEMNNGTLRRGAANNDFRVINGTSQLAGMSPDGAAVLFSLPATANQMFVRTFRADAAGQSSICDSVGGTDGGSIRLPFDHMWTLEQDNPDPLISLTDPRTIPSIRRPTRPPMRRRQTSSESASIPHRKMRRLRAATVRISNSANYLTRLRVHGL
jgi:hypothetical protein